MIRVGSITGCCDDGVAAAGRDDTVVFNGMDGVFNGDCLAHISGGLSSIVY